MPPSPRTRRASSTKLRRKASMKTSSVGPPVELQNSKLVPTCRRCYAIIDLEQSILNPAPNLPPERRRRSLPVFTNPFSRKSTSQESGNDSPPKGRRRSLPVIKNPFSILFRKSAVKQQQEAFTQEWNDDISPFNISRSLSKSTKLNNFLRRFSRGSSTASESRSPITPDPSITRPTEFAFTFNNELDYLAAKNKAEECRGSCYSQQDDCEDRFEADYAASIVPITDNSIIPNHGRLNPSSFGREMASRLAIPDITLKSPTTINYPKVNTTKSSTSEPKARLDWVLPKTTNLPSPQVPEPTRKAQRPSISKHTTLQGPAAKLNVSNEVDDAVRMASASKGPGDWKELFNEEIFPQKTEEARSLASIWERYKDKPMPAAMRGVARDDIKNSHFFHSPPEWGPDVTPGMEMWVLFAHGELLRRALEHVVAHEGCKVKGCRHKYMPSDILNSVKPPEKKVDFYDAETDDGEMEEDNEDDEEWFDATKVALSARSSKKWRKDRSRR